MTISKIIAVALAAAAISLGPLSAIAQDAGTNAMHSDKANDTMGKSHDSMGKNTMGKDTMGKDTMGKDSMGKNTMDKGTTGKDEMTKDAPK